MRIVIDLQPDQTASRYRGTGRYSLGLARAMIAEGKRHEFIIALNHAFPETIDSVWQAFADLLPPESILPFSTLTPVAGLNPNNQWRCQASELVREYFLVQLRPDWVHVSSLFEGLMDNAVTSIGCFAHLATTATLYDLTPYRDQEHYLANPVVKAWYMRKLEHLRKAELVLAISEYTRREAIEMLGLPADRIANISADASARFQVLPRDQVYLRRLQGRYGLRRDFIMYTAAGTDYNKNIDRLLKAYALLPVTVRAAHQLVVCCRVQDYERSRLEGVAAHVGLGKDEVVLTGYVSDEDLVALYNLCKLFVFPSLAEGFGLPVLEAMRCGAPVIGSNSTSIPEVVGLEAALFDPTSVNSIRDKLCEALTDNQFRRRLRENGQVQAGKFSWNASARRALEALEAAHEHRQHALLENRPLSVTVEPEPVSPRPPEKSEIIEYSAELLRAIAALPTKSVPSSRELAEVAEAIAENTLVQGRRHLLVDITAVVLAGGRTGIQRVVRSILQKLASEPPAGYHVKPVYRSEGTYRYARRFMAEFVGSGELGLRDAPVDVAPGDIFLGLDLDVGMNESSRDWLRYHAQRGLKLYFIVYDLLPVLRPDCFSVAMCTLFRAWLEGIAPFADGLVCISRTLVVELAEWLKRRSVTRTLPLHIGYFHLGADVEASLPTSGVSPAEAALLTRLADHTNILMVGTVEPRKGYAQTVNALEQLWPGGEDVCLVIVGRQGWMVEGLVKRLRAHPEVGKRLVWLENASDELLGKLYRASSALLVASEGEGFGLPLVEAARHKIPIIARDLPVFREVAGDHAFYFTGTDSAALAGALKTWLDLYRRGEHPRSEGIRWLTWEESAGQLKQIIFESKWAASWEPGPGFHWHSEP